MFPNVHSLKLTINTYSLEHNPMSLEDMLKEIHTSAKVTQADVITDTLTTFTIEFTTAFESVPEVSRTIVYGLVDRGVGVGTSIVQTYVM